MKGTSLVYPRVVSGALVGIHPNDPRPTVILFQYNPDTLSRTLQPQMGAEGGDKTEALRLKGAPVETIKAEIELDAHRPARARRASTARELGIHPQLAALESLVYPRAQHVITNTRLLALGTIEILPPVAPLTLFVWGPKRVLRGQAHRAGHHGGGARRQAEPDPREGLARAARAHLQRPAARAPRLLAVPRAPGGEGGDGRGRAAREASRTSAEAA